MNVSRDLLFEFLDPLHISLLVDARTSNLARLLSTKGINETKMQNHVKGRWEMVI